MNCIVEGCTRQKYRRDWCAMHNRRIALTGEPGPAHALVPGKPKGYTAQDILSFHGWTETPDGCWLWGGRVNKDGYGVVTFQTRYWLAHRLVYHTYVAPLDDRHVLHTCDTPQCVRPTHLFLGTNRDNVDDKIEKGRQTKGESHPKAKLTDEMAGIIKHSSEPNYVLARRYDVDPSVISKIKNGRRWTHV